jgi:PUA domain protein
MPEQVDKGAIKFVLSGANIMCPGLTSPGGKMTPCEKNQIVVITAEGKYHALAIGQTKLSTNEMYLYYFHLLLSLIFFFY